MSGTPTEQVLRYLSTYEMKACPRDEQFGFSVADELLYLADTVKMPGWVSIRAASCVLKWYPQSGFSNYVSWVSDPESAGLARVVVSELDQLAEAQAHELAIHVLEGPLIDWAKPKLAVSKHASVRQLVSTLHKP